MSTSLTVRRTVALAVAAVAVETAISGTGAGAPRHGPVAGVDPGTLASVAHALTMPLALGLLTIAPWLWRGARVAIALAVGGLLVLACFEAIGELAPAESIVDLAVALLLGCAAFGSVRTGAQIPSAGPGAGVPALASARAIVERHGEDSLAPFLLRADKAFAFAADGVLGYRVVGETAVVSGDPVAPGGQAPAVLAAFLGTARQHRWRVAIYGASARHVEDYRRLGLRAICVGQEAIVHPERFTLEGRPVRKLRQSVHRIERRGWELSALNGRDIDARVEAEIDALEAKWRAGHGRLTGFVMGMGAAGPGVRPQDLYLLARSPEGELGAVMHFIAHCGKLSLDTMRRVGATPNGLNEALVCRALQLARERDIPEVSLNYAGLAHLVRGTGEAGRLRRASTALALRVLGRSFQMEKLVRFNEKFSPEWRPRYLVYESRLALPRSVVRVLQAEGYLPRRPPRAARLRRTRRPVVGPARPAAGGGRLGR